MKEKGKNQKTTVVRRPIDKSREQYQQAIKLAIDGNDDEALEIFENLLKNKSSQQEKKVSKSPEDRPGMNTINQRSRRLVNAITQSTTPIITSEINENSLEDVLKSFFIAIKQKKYQKAADLAIQANILNRKVETSFSGGLIPLTSILELSQKSSGSKQIPEQRRKSIFEIVRSKSSSVLSAARRLSTSDKLEPSELNSVTLDNILTSSTKTPDSSRHYFFSSPSSTMQRLRKQDLQSPTSSKTQDDDDTPISATQEKSERKEKKEEKKDAESINIEDLISKGTAKFQELSYTESLECFRKAADALVTVEDQNQKQFTSELIHELACKLCDINQYQTALRFLEISIALNNPQSMYLAGEINYYGYFNQDGSKIEINYEKAAELFEKSSKSGYFMGTIYLGICHFCGHGIEQDFAAAFPLLKITEDFLEKLECDEPTQIMFFIGVDYLAQCYHLGRGVEIDLIKANELYSKTILATDNQITKSHLQELMSLLAYVSKAIKTPIIGSEIHKALEEARELTGDSFAEEKKESKDGQITHNSEVIPEATTPGTSFTPKEATAMKDTSQQTEVVATIS